MAKTEMLTIAFRNGGILPAEITGGEERRVAAHEPVSVPKAYGQHLVDDRFAYPADPEESKQQVEQLTVSQRKKLEARLESLRADHTKADDVEIKAKLAAEIDDIAAQLK